MEKTRIIDDVPRVINCMPKTIADDEKIFGFIWAVLETFKERFDRIVMLDVFERFSYFEETMCVN